MPLFKTIPVSSSILTHIWRIDETESELSAGVSLTEHCQNRMAGMKSEIHRRGFLSIRHLLAKAGYADNDLHYDDQGKPHLGDGKKISITHSDQFTGIIISDHREVGIDIERQRDKILRIAHKFTSIKEYRTLANTDALIRKLTVVWSAKESLYKSHTEPGLSFLNHIHINDFSLSDQHTTGEVRYKGRTANYDINFFEFKDYSCVYAVGSL